jgi:FkbM family methyltransferase
MVKISDALFKGRKYLRSKLPHGYHLYRQRKQIFSNLPERARQIIENLSIGDICIDCGANIGSATTLFAKYGASVLAFEPHPEAFRVLKINTRKYHRVKVLQNAVVADDTDSVFLKFTDIHAEDSLRASIGASISQTKPNLIEDGIQIGAVNLINFIESQTHIAILKIDIEGYETELVPKLLESDCLERVDHVFLETHASPYWPDSQQKTNRMISQIGESKHFSKFILEWP